MTKPRFSGLGGVMRGQVDNPTPELNASDVPPGEMPPGDEDEDEEDCEAGDGRKSKKKEPGMKDTDTNAQAQAAASVQQQASSSEGDAVANARADERKRVADVFASENVKGREQAAAALLADSDMSAEKIVALLPNLTPAASAVDEGQQMLETMRQGADADLGNGGGMAAEENHGWGKIHEEIRATRA